MNGMPVYRKGSQSIVAMATRQGGGRSTDRKRPGLARGLRS
jgi:hypothetical protein